MARGSSHGSVRKRTENGRWQARYVTPAGDRFSITKDTQREARQWLRDRLEEVEEGEHDRRRKAECMTFGQWYADWLELLTVRDSTEIIYRGLAVRFLLPEFGEMRLAAITTLDVQRWWAKSLVRADGTPYKDSYRAKTYRVLKLILGDAVEHGLLKENPCRVKDARDTWEERRPPTEHEVDLLADSAPERFRALILIAGYCGLRWGEVAGLRRHDIDLTDHIITVAGQALELPGGRLSYGPPKTAAGRRTVTMPRFVSEALADHMAWFTKAGSDAVVFTFATSDTFMRRSNFRSRVWLPTLGAAGLTGIRFHDLRHTAGTLAAQEGGTVTDVQRRLGHSTPRAALIYQHATEERDMMIADALDARRLKRRKANLRAV
jgi:integrase